MSKKGLNLIQLKMERKNSKLVKNIFPKEHTHKTNHKEVKSLRKFQEDSIGSWIPNSGFTMTQYYSRRFLM